jgi:hypothetical protein
VRMVHKSIESIQQPCRHRLRRTVFRVEPIISSLTTSVASVTWSTFHKKVRLLIAQEVKQ